MDRTLRQRHALSIASIAGIFVGLHVLFALELWLDLRHSARHSPLTADQFWAALDGSAAMARGAGTTISRAYNILVSLVVSSIALAIPLTANMYTPKLVEIFIRDRVNMGVLSFFVLSSAQAIWSTQATWDQGALKEWGGVYPRTSLWVSFEAVTLGWSVLIPYFYYVLRFLDPTNIIDRVTALVTDQYARIPRPGASVGAGAGARDAAAGADLTRMEAAQRELEQGILHLGNVILRAIDRADRDVTLDAVRALKRVVIVYQAEKDGLPEAWFRVALDIFVGLSHDAVVLIRRDRIWVEQKCLQQLQLAFNASLSKMQDAISSIGDVNREIVLNAEAQADVPAMRLGIRFFNTFLREAVRQKDTHAIFDVFQQYKELAHDLLHAHADLALEIGWHMKYYAEFARLTGLVFVYELAVYDIERMVEWAVQSEARKGRDLLSIMLGFDAVPQSVRLFKAKAIAGGFFREKGLAEEEGLVRAALAAVPPEVAERGLRDLMGTTDPIFWEVTDRQVNIDYVGEERKKATAAFAETLRTVRAAMPPPAGSAGAG